MTSAVWERTGQRGEIEPVPPASSTPQIRLAIVAQLPGIGAGELPRVTPSRAGTWREHLCPKARGAFSAANFNRKRR